MALLVDVHEELRIRRIFGSGYAGLGYATGVFSSRGIVKKLKEDLAFRMLAAGNFPKHRTTCEFRRWHLEDFQNLFVEVIRLAWAMGLANFGKLSVDGTNVWANASKRKAMSYERMQWRVVWRR